MIVKTKHTIIAIAVMIAAAVIGFVGAAMYMTANRTGNFAQNGYVLTLDTSEDEEVIVKNEYRFNSGGEWELEKNGHVSFQTADGGVIQVGQDRFVHYENGSAGVLTDAVAANLDGYPDGIINYYNLTPEYVLETADGKYRYQDALQEYLVENMLVKSADLHYLVLSPTMELAFGDGTTEKIEGGYLEISYPNQEGIAVQFTDGVRAWQVLREGCTVTLANGVVLGIAEEEIRVPDSAFASGSRTSVGFDELTITKSSPLLAGFQNGQRKAQQLAAPIFNFFLNDGEDGEDGLDGISGANGTDGEAGLNGEAGTNGAEGADGGNGTTGAAGPGGLAGEDAENGGDSDEITILGTPKCVIGNWEQSGTELSFDVAYEDLSLEYITREDRAWNVSIYEVGGDGTPIESWTVDSPGYGDTGDFDQIPSQNDVGEGNTPALKFHTNKLEPDKEYRVVVRDTYKLNDNKSEFAACDVAERTFATDVSGVHLDLLGSSENSLNVALSAQGGSIDPGTASLVCMASGSDPKSGKYVPMTAEFKDDSGNTETVTYDWIEIKLNADGSKDIIYYKHEEGQDPVPVKTLKKDAEPGADYEDVLSNIEIPNMPSGTEVKIFSKVDVTMEGDTQSFEKKLSAVVETRKKAPVVGGVTLEAYEGGFLRAEIHGPYDDAAAEYGEIQDEDNVLLSVSYDIYDENGFRAGCRRDANGDIIKFEPSKEYPALAAKKVDVEAGETSADFLIDNETLKSNTWYYVVANYTYTDGVSEWTVPVIESWERSEDPADPDSYMHTKDKQGWARAILDEEKHVSMSFNAAGCGIYNNAMDQNEGVTYHSINGLMSVKMSGQKIMVSDIYPMSLSITGTPGYEQTVTYTSCNGSQGVYGGSFDLNVGLDGLLESHAYTFTLNGYLYNASTGEYEYQPIATNVISTDKADTVEVGLTRSNIGTGVEFTLGGLDFNDTASDDTAVYAQGTDDYYRNIPAAYRNISTIAFNLYPKVGDSDEPQVDPIGVAYVTLNEEDQASAAEYGKLYDYFYGNYILDPSKSAEYENTVGIGEGFQFRFVYTNAGASSVTLNRKKAGDLIEMSDLEDYGYSYNTFLIDARVGYDYTNERYVYSKNLTDKERAEGVTDEQLQEYKAQELYTYYKDWAAEGLFKSDYINTLAVKAKACLVNSSNRPTSPLVYQPNAADPAITLNELTNSYGVHSPEETDITEFNFGADENAGGESGGVYDPFYDEVASVGLRLTTKYDINYTTSLTYYGFHYDDFYPIKPAESLDNFKGELDRTTADRAMLKFTINDFGTVNDDNTVTCHYIKNVNGTDVVRVPEVWVLFYDSSDPDSELSKKIAESAAAGKLRKTQTADWGYDYYYYDSERMQNEGKYCYTDPVSKTDIIPVYVDVNEEKNKADGREVIRRGGVYIFAMDSKLNYWDTDKHTYDFSYPSDYYGKGWVMDGATRLSYTKDNALQSNPAAVVRTIPECESRFVSTVESDDSSEMLDTWRIRLVDRDHAIYNESFANAENKNVDMNVLGGLLLNPGGEDSEMVLPGGSYLRARLSVTGTRWIEIRTKENEGAPDVNAAENGCYKYAGFNSQEEAVAEFYRQLTSDDGLEIVIHNRSPQTVRCYQWNAVYNLCETKYYSHTSAGQKSLPLLIHNYVGNASFQDHFRIVDGAVSQDNPYGIRMSSDNNTLTVSILAREGEEFDETAFRNVAAIAVTAYNVSGYEYQENGRQKTGHWIYRFRSKSDKVEDGYIRAGNGYMTQWVSEFQDISTGRGDEAKVIGKQFSYKVSDFQHALLDTYKQNDKIQFFYRVYYTDGTSYSPALAYDKNKDNRDLWNTIAWQDGTSGDKLLSYFAMKQLSETDYLHPRSTIMDEEGTKGQLGAHVGLVPGEPDEKPEGGWTNDKIPENTQLIFNYYLVPGGEVQPEYECYDRGAGDNYSGRELLSLTVSGREIGVESASGADAEKVMADGSYTLPSIPRQRMALADFQLQAGLSMASSYVQVVNYGGISKDSRIAYLLYEWNPNTVPYAYYKLDFSKSTEITPEDIENGATPEKGRTYYKKDGNNYIECRELTDFEPGATYCAKVTLTAAYRTEQKPVEGDTYYIQKRDKDNVVSYELADMSDVKDFSCQYGAYKYMGAMLGGVGKLNEDGKDYFQLTGLEPGHAYYIVPYCLDDTMFSDAELAAGDKFAEKLRENGISDDVIDKAGTSTQYSVSDPDGKAVAEAIKNMVENSYTQVTLKQGVLYDGGMYYVKNGDNYVLKTEAFTPAKDETAYVKSFYRFDNNESVRRTQRSEGRELDGYPWTVDFEKNGRLGLDNINTYEYTWNPDRNNWTTTRNPDQLVKQLRTADGSSAYMYLNGNMFFEKNNNILNGLNQSNLNIHVSVSNLRFENEDTKVYYFMKRQSLEGGDWELIIEDECCPAVKDKTIEERLKAEYLAGKYKDWSYYGKDQSFCGGPDGHKAELSGSYRLRFYPGDERMQPGYRYQVVALVLQEYADGSYTVLNIQESDGGLNCYTNSKEWKKYDGEPLAANGTKLESYTTKDIYYSVKIDNQSGILVDNGYYVRLCRQMKDEDGKIRYETIEDEDCYESATIRNSHGAEFTRNGQNAMNSIYSTGNTVTYHFQIKDEWKSNTDTYRLQYYAYVDKDFDNYHEMAGGYDENGNLILAGNLEASQGSAELGSTPDYNFNGYASKKGGEIDSGIQVYELTEGRYVRKTVNFGELLLAGSCYICEYDIVPADAEPEPGETFYVKEYRPTKDTYAVSGKTYYDENGKAKAVPEEEDYKFEDHPDDTYYVPSYRAATTAELAAAAVKKYRRNVAPLTQDTVTDADMELFDKEPDIYTPATVTDPNKIYYVRSEYYPTPETGEKVIVNTMRPYRGSVYDCIYEQKLAVEKGYIKDPLKESSYDMDLSRAQELLIGTSEDIQLPETEEILIGDLTNHVLNGDKSVTFYFKDTYGLELADFVECQVTYNGTSTIPVRIERDTTVEDGTVMDENGRQGAVALTVRGTNVEWTKGEKYLLTLVFYKNPGEDDPDGPVEKLFGYTREFEF